MEEQRGKMEGKGWRGQQTTIVGIGDSKEKAQTPILSRTSILCSGTRMSLFYYSLGGGKEEYEIVFTMVLSRVSTSSTLELVTACSSANNCM